MSFAMAKPTPIDTRHDLGAPSELATDIQSTLYPFTRITNVLLKTAREEYFKQNTMFASITRYIHNIRQRVLNDDPVYRGDIMHLVVSLPTVQGEYMISGAGVGTASARADVVLLKRVLGLYPKLETLTVRVTNVVHDSAYDYFPHDPAALARYEEDQRQRVQYTLAYLTVVVEAVSALPSHARLKAKSIDFKHRSQRIVQPRFASPEIPADLTATELLNGEGEEEAAADLAWQVMDLPAALVRFPIIRNNNSRLQVPASDDSLSCDEDGEVIGELLAPFQFQLGLTD